MKTTKNSEGEKDRAKGQALRRRRRSGFRSALRARLLEEIRADASLADQFRGLLLRGMDERRVTEADLARACGCSLENIR